MNYKALTLITSTIAALSLASCNDEKTAQQGGPEQGPMPTPVATPVEKEIDLTETFTGRFAASEMVEVRSRVSGYIKEIHFTEGQFIQEGQPMFSIDPSIYDAELAMSKANVSQIETAIKLADTNLNRAKELVAKKALSTQELDIRQSEYDQAQANLRSAQAQVEQAELNRGYADIAAPISGVASRHLVTRGNYISGGNGSSPVLTTVIPQNPIYIFFEVNEKQAISFAKLYSGKNVKDTEVQIALSNDKEFSYSGKLNYIDNQLDRATGTLQLRATVNNDDGALTPGLFAKVKVPLGNKSKYTLVQESVLGFEQNKRYLWVLQPDQTLAKRYVETGPLLDDLRVITSGIELTDKVAIGRIQFVRPQTPVQPIPAEMLPEAKSADSAQPAAESSASATPAKPDNKKVTQAPAKAKSQQNSAE